MATRRSGVAVRRAADVTTDAASGFLIDEKGDVQFPYAGTVHVAGKDVGTIQKELYNRLSKVYQKPEVTVRVASFRNAQVFVDGEVRTPGAQSINDITMTLTSAISQSSSLFAVLSTLACGSGHLATISS